MPQSHAATSPSPRHDAGLRQTARKVSWSASSTIAGSAQRRASRSESQGSWRRNSSCRAPRSASLTARTSSASVRSSRPPSRSVESTGPITPPSGPERPDRFASPRTKFWIVPDVWAVLSRFNGSERQGLPRCCEPGGGLSGTSRRRDREHVAAVQEVLHEEAHHRLARRGVRDRGAGGCHRRRDARRQRRRPDRRARPRVRRDPHGRSTRSRATAAPPCGSPSSGCRWARRTAPTCTPSPAASWRPTRAATTSTRRTGPSRSPSARSGSTSRRTARAPR